MNCPEMRELLDGYLDGELDLVRSLEAEQHLKDCPACRSQYEAQQALRKVVVERSQYFEAPPALQRRVREAVRRDARSEAPRARWRWNLGRLWPRLLVPLAAAALVLLFAVPWLAQPSAESRLAQAVLSAHIRSLMTEHMTDVASSDQHTVKPWFNGKVTFSPPVVDLSAQGFPLVGGRLDVVEDQPVAALVYQRRKHFINLFIWPSNRSGSAREKALTQRGYNLVRWTKADMEFWAVSDLSRDDLEEFARLAGL
jgi:anti-sigma factor RsiW